MTPEEIPPGLSARGTIRVAVQDRSGRSVLGGLRQAGSLKVLFPRRSGGALEAVLVNTAGGITGGDRFSVEASVAAGAALTLTTQAAERAYQAKPGQTGQLRTHLTAGEGARLDWLPQETILFAQSALDRRLSVDLGRDARLLLCEPLVFGRAAMGEVLTNARLRDRIEIDRDGQPLYRDAMTLGGDIAAHMGRSATGGGAGTLASLVFAAPEAAAHIGPIRALLPPSGGVSLVRDGLLALRLLAPDSFELRKFLLPILTRLHGGPLPRPWML